jgi:hypothetical protein
MLRDLENRTVIAAHIDPISAGTTDDKDGTTVDMQNYHHCLFLGYLGIEGITLSGTNAIHLELEHSDDNSSWADCADADLTTSVTGDVTGTWAVCDADAEIPALFTTEYIGTKRYVRAHLNMKGTHGTGTPVSVISVKYGPKILPAA